MHLYWAIIADIQRMASNALDVHVQIQNGGAMVFQMQGLDTIRTLCREVSMKLGVEENGVRVRYTGKILDRSNSLSYLGVRPETVLKVEVSLIPLSVPFSLCSS